METKTRLTDFFTRKRDPVTFTQLISPEQAQYMLESMKYEHQRQPRRGKIQDYADEMTRGTFRDLTQIFIAIYLGQHVLLDGQHRLHAKDDKERIVEAALRHPYHAGLSDQQIADHCGVSINFVNELSRHLTREGKIDRPTTRTVSRNGKTYQQNTSNIGKTKKQTPTPKPEPEDEEPLTPYEQQIADQYRPTISEPVRVSDDTLNEEVDRLINQYGYDDLARLVELLAERIAVEI